CWQHVRMKTNSLPLIIGFMNLLAATPSFATGATFIPAPSSIMSLARSNATSVRLTITNAGDQSWIIQSSSNLVDWLEVESWKIHNGSFHSSYDSASKPGFFYRAFYDPARQTILSTTASALLL